MAIFTIADLHLSLGTDKPMDKFKGWNDYVSRIEKNWMKLIKPCDTIVLPGDISWAMKLENTIEDFKFIEKLPGEKYIIKGNHDYWWSTITKMDKFCQENDFKTIHFINNNCVFVEGYALCGTRSWLFDIDEPHDSKVMNRELGRLRASLDMAGDAEKIVFLHYPPMYQSGNADEIVSLLDEYDIKECYYGHLHGASINYAVQGVVEGRKYKLISADGISFCPFKIK